jgi:membrane protein implicated in regulation of membrane protease activity
MTTQHNSKMARWVALGTAAYLVLAVIAFVTGIRPPLSLIFLPAAYILVAPTPLLAIFGLAEQSWLLSLPNTAGFIFLIVLYTCLAYFLTRYIERHHRTRNGMTE